ncbi:nucleoside triphosphate pyrophosphohydrolase [Tahibacter harae]|uniref:Nucleoside triphosphate pyrophosphohydrolase n=1 Tax=Tahibacter harae TaxID=2963937 RepID=A0ABT1QY48_9GAMM|nr:nucleoside triphosphate pyrophosphohydrolase [Tahibacter harae]MCQ4167207.1 nucleoside triphosphate pyrophosphohydrolase [Tahibacter harae]
MADIAELLRIMAALRNPQGGCPWDLEQDFASIAPYTIEESYEVADAIDRNDMPALCDELGDLLFQVVFHAQMAQEAGHFGFADVVEAICGKMLRRHPHVFGGSAVADAQAQTVAWEEHKRAERSARGEADRSALAGISRGLPEWQRALKLQKRAAAVGFDWPDAAPVFDKLHEELDEVRAEFAGGDPARLSDEIGDLLFVCVNLARHAKVDVSAALRGANAKFERRFRRMEQLAGEGGLAALDLAAQDRLWDAAKAEERAAPPMAE